MRWLKVLVMGTGALIVLAMVALAVGLVHKAKRRPVAETPPVTFGTVKLPLADGCAIRHMTAETGRLFVLIGPEGPCARVFVLDAESGALLGTIEALQ